MEVLEKSAAWQRAARGFKVDELSVQVFNTLDDLAADAAQEVNQFLIETIRAKGSAAAILATGNSQIQFLKRLVALEGIDWSRITLFHMDEYLGIDANHKASFRRYMRERVQTLVKPRAFHFLEGDVDLPLDECARYESLLKAQAIDLCCLGIGENGHLAFNDPPVARFEEKHLVKLVKLDDACKIQQVKEGHFPSLDAVPPYAFTLTIPALCSARKMICIAPEKRKADAVRNALTGPISTHCPASILRKQKHCTLLLDHDSVGTL
ncbi:MAG TPA: glucosamine-6-phosphate deaminase [Candidatus Kapabacteria bacterium]|nr:glucosamine-6-phosphate deaminase [Candidatus Kapabacteria bacterium]